MKPNTSNTTESAELPAIKKAREARRKTVPFTVAISFDTYRQIHADADKQRRQVGQLGRIILEDHYSTEDQSPV